MEFDVIVIGGGCAGLACATALTSQGRKVLVLERKPYLGGRASSHVDAVSGEILDNGQHLFLGCYDETRAYLQRTRADALLRFFSGFETPLFGMEGSRATLKTGNLPAPLHMLVGILGLESLSLMERFRVAKVALAARWGDEKKLSRQSVLLWLRSLSQSDRSIERFWEPLVLATLNADLAKVGADQLAVVLRQGFMASKEASRIGLSTVGLTDLIGQPAKSMIESSGGQVRTRCRIRRFLFESEQVVGVALDSGETLRAKQIVSSVPPDALLALCEGGPSALMRLVEPIRALQPSPILSLHLWLEGFNVEAPWMGFWGTTFHWLFQRKFILSDPRTRHVTLVLSAATSQMKKTKAELVALATMELSAALGQSLKVERAVLIKEPTATWIAPLGNSMARLSPGKVYPGLSICGDWTQTGLPGTIESAIASGHRAAQSSILTQ